MKLFKAMDKNESITYNNMDYNKDECVIEDILKHTYTGKAKKRRKFHELDFLIKWQGQPNTENRWLSYNKLKNTSKLQEYMSIHHDEFLNYTE